MVLHHRQADFIPERFFGPREVPPMSFFTPGSGLIRVLSRVMTLSYLDFDAVPQLVECLEFLPNLHTLEIGSSERSCSARWIKMVLTWRVVLPQIKTLIIPKFAYPLLRRCPNVEDVVWVITDKPVTSDKFLRSLPPSWRSKVKRLTIPLLLSGNTSRKWSGTLWRHRVRTVTNCLWPQDT